MDPLTPEEFLEWRLLELGNGADSLMDFVTRINPSYVKPEHLRPVAELIAQAQFSGVRATISLGPRSGKSELIKAAIVWFMGQYPEKNIAYLTYAQDLASNKSQEAMQLALEAGVPIAESPQRQDHWRSALAMPGGTGGNVYAKGVNGVATGLGFDVIFVDDPYKGRKDAESPLQRAQLYEWFTGVALTRLQPGGSCFVIHARWHEDDIIGRLNREQPGAWTNINLPAVKDDGEPLFKEFWSKEALELRRKEIGEYDWASLYLGQPMPKGGAMLKADPTFYSPEDIRAGRLQQPGTQLLISCDPAATKSARSDHSVIMVGAGRVRNGLLEVDILDVWRDRVEVPELVRRLAHYQLRWQCPVAVEAVGGFKSVPQALREVNRGLQVIEVKAAADKLTRALPLQAAWNDHRICLPRLEVAPWVGPLVRELKGFTGMGDREDDQVDALAHMVRVFSDSVFRRRTEIDFKKILPFG